MDVPEFTGERYFPGLGGAQIAYEHLHRYLFAARWAGKRDVLDLACGSGYGAEMLAAGARRVIAIEWDRSAVRYAKEKSRRDNAGYVQANGLKLPLSDRSMDLVVAFEILEHIREQDELLAEIGRVLRPGGVALISTPNRATYSDQRNYSNPYHVKELYREEFERLLAAHFRHAALLKQQVRGGSHIHAERSASAADEILSQPPPGLDPAPAPALYFLAVCSLEAPAPGIPRESFYLDPADSLFREIRAEIEGWKAEGARLNDEIEKLGEWGRRLEAVLREKEQTLAEVIEQVGLRDDTIRQLQAEMIDEVGRRDAVILETQKTLEERTEWTLRLDSEISARDGTIRGILNDLDRTDRELKAVAARLGRIRGAFLYRVLCRLGVLPR